MEPLPFLLLVAAGAALAPAIASAAVRWSGRATRWGVSGARRRLAALLIATPLLFAIGFLTFGSGLRTLLFALYAAAFLLLAAIDLEHRIVPNKLVLPALLLAPVAGWLWGHSPLSMLLGGAIHMGIFFLSGLLLKGAIGMGDVKLAAVLGILTGFPAVLTSLLAGAFLSGLVSAGLLLTRVRSTRDYIPFAPFMLGGALIAILLRPGAP